MEGLLFVKYTKGVPFLSEMVYIERQGVGPQGVASSYGEAFLRAPWAGLFFFPLYFSQKANKAMHVIINHIVHV